MKSVAYTLTLSYTTLDFQKIVVEIEIILVLYSLHIRANDYIHIYIYIYFMLYVNSAFE